MAKKAEAAGREAGCRLVELRAENFKILKAVRIRPDRSVMRITGRNAQGKSSVLDVVVAALGGPALFPAEPVRAGEETAEIFLDLAKFTVTRKIWRTDDGGYSQKVTVQNADGTRPGSPQAFLNALRGSPLADDPLEFSRMKPKEQFDVLRGLVRGYDFEAKAAERKAAYDDRTQSSRELARARGALQSMQIPEVVPRERVDVVELSAMIRQAVEANSILEQRVINRLAARAEAEKLRDAADLLRAEAKQKDAEAEAIEKRLANAEPLPDPVDVEPLEAKLAAADKINAAFRQAAERQAKAEEVKKLEAEHAALDEKIARLDAERMAAIEGAKLPVGGLSLGDEEILLNGLPFSQASTAEKIRTATALLMALKPEIRILLIREGSLLDEDALAALEEQARRNDFVVLMECVGGDAAGGLLIEDGEIVA